MRQLIIVRKDLGEPVPFKTFDDLYELITR